MKGGKLPHAGPAASRWARCLTLPQPRDCNLAQTKEDYGNEEGAKGGGGRSGEACCGGGVLWWSRGQSPVRMWRPEKIR
jgi:hypothetical protein